MSLHYTNALPIENLSDNLDNLSISACDRTEQTPIKEYQDSLKVTLIPYTHHCHHLALQGQHCRDVHQLIIDIFHTLNEKEKSNYYIIRGLNKLITKWHYTPQEAWKAADGIWTELAHFLTDNFPPDTNPTIMKIFNNC